MDKEAQSSPLRQPVLEPDWVDGRRPPWEDDEPYTEIQGVSSRKIGWILEQWQGNTEKAWQQEVKSRTELACTTCELWRNVMQDSYEWQWGKEEGARRLSLTLEGITLEILLSPTMRERWLRWTQRKLSQNPPGSV